MIACDVSHVAMFFAYSSDAGFVVLVKKLFLKQFFKMSTKVLHSQRLTSTKKPYLVNMAMVNIIYDQADGLSYACLMNSQVDFLSLLQ